MIHPDPAADARLKLESRRVSHDATIWPLPRGQMQHPGLCVERMAQDMLDQDVLRTGLLARLTALGWSAVQIDRHKQSAVTAARRLNAA